MSRAECKLGKSLLVMTLALPLRVEMLLVPFYHRGNSHASPELLLKVHQATPETQLGEMLLGTQKEASL